jgi:hypothetical protein
MTKKDLLLLQTRARILGLKIETHNPGDGIRCRFFNGGDESDFFGPSSGYVTYMTTDECNAFMEGWICRSHPRKKF